MKTISTIVQWMAKIVHWIKVALCFAIFVGFVGGVIWLNVSIVQMVMAKGYGLGVGLFMLLICWLTVLVAPFFLRGERVVEVHRWH
ncbi:MAG: hypothetical protein WBD34_13470 [Burkholderiaceae bacterium]